LAELFTKSALPPGVLLTDVGLHPGRPFQILGLLEAPDFGDLLANVVFLSSIANQFEHVRLHVKFRDICPCLRAIMVLSPWIDLAEPLPGDWPRILRWLLPRDQLRRPPRLLNVGSQKGKHVYLYDMIVTSPMTARKLVHALTDIVPLRLPERQADECRARLIAKGLEPDRWVATFHCPGGSDPSAFDALIDRIVALGGQAVQLGHPDTATFRARNGFVDLSRTRDSFLLQAAAVCHSRFMIAGPSDWMVLALAFAVPLTLVDAAAIGGVWNLDRTDVLTHEVTTPEGRILRNASLRESGLLDGDVLTAQMKATPGYRIRKANADELDAVAQRLHDRTADCPAWRAPAKVAAGPKANQIMWPVEPTDPMPWLDL
jgi:putative glycosyltransferase (TIGR04372 family)